MINGIAEFFIKLPFLRFVILGTFLCKFAPLLLYFQISQFYVFFSTTKHGCIMKITFNFLTDGKHLKIAKANLDHNCKSAKIYFSLPKQRRLQGS